jgi:hypothetical protein
MPKHNNLSLTPLRKQFFTFKPTHSPVPQKISHDQKTQPIKFRRLNPQTKNKFHSAPNIDTKSIYKESLATKAVDSSPVTIYEIPDTTSTHTQIAPINKLPPLLTLDQYKGNLTNYVDAVHQNYKSETVSGNLTFQNLPIKYQFSPAYNGKGFTFWHCITNGKDEKHRPIDMKRCERIGWIPWMIRNAKGDAHSPVTYWETIKRQSTHVVILHEKERYLVVLAKYKNHYLFRTAYYHDPKYINPKTLTQTDTLPALIKERNAYWSRKSKSPVSTNGVFKPTITIKLNTNNNSIKAPGLILK